ncbi:MAG: putative porin [Muribaculaceae bacterium]|nr:putative porin [Muribaculaceae bacterium]
MRRIYIFILIIAFLPLLSTAKKKTKLEPGYAWKITPPLGLREESTIDTLLLNYYRQSVPSDVSDAYATTGNLGAEGLNLIFFDRQPMSDFFFNDALYHWLPAESKMKFYNTRIPMTLLSYNTGGGRDNAQDRLSGVFSGNINKQAQIGALVDYLYSKGSYNNQADKDFTWGFSGSYIGEKYEFQGYFNHFNFLNKENGGITNDLFITDPAEVQGGSTSIRPKNIPTRLNNSHSRVVGTELYLNNRYKLGYYHEDPPVEGDTVPRRTYVPVSSIIWTLKYNDNKHIFNATSNENGFWERSYLNAQQTYDRTTAWSLTNTVGISLLEGFNKWAKAGLSAFATYRINKYFQTPDTITGTFPLPDGLIANPHPEIAPKGTENFLWIGGQLTKQQGKILNYSATAQIGMVARAAGEVKLDGEVNTHIPLFGDTVSITGYGHFYNVAAPYFMNNYISNHFIWKNDFGKRRSLKAGGFIDIPFSRTHLDVGVENIQNHIYFNSDCLPTQYSGNVQIISARLQQNFKFGVLNWENTITYQTSTQQSVIPLPKLAVYSNLYLLFRVAGVLHVQIGVDCDYYTKYKSVNYQPATMSFYNQNEVECGNYPFMNAYANMKLSKARFYIMYSHVNQGLFGSNYFSMPHYPLNPRRFQFGISVDFAN